MNYRTQTDICLLIFDMHQHVDWVRRILQAEEGNWSHLLMGGDYFDSKSRKAASTAETCDLLLELWASHKESITFLLGNHDIPYLEGRREFVSYQNPRHLAYKLTGYSNSKGKKINKHLSDEFWKECRLFQVINGYLISHAGLTQYHWSKIDHESDPLKALDAQCSHSIANLGKVEDTLLMPSACRGGDAEIGGITWLDWDEEFIDDLPLPQIVGHTSSLLGARRNGRSWCIDGRQSCYALLNRNGELTIKLIEG